MLQSAGHVKAGIDTDAVTARLLREEIGTFGKSWNDLMACIAAKTEAVKAA